MGSFGGALKLSPHDARNPEITEMVTEIPSPRPVDIMPEMIPTLPVWLKKQHRSDVQLSERLASLGIVEAPIEDPSNHHNIIVLRGLRGPSNVPHYAEIQPHIRRQFPPLVSPRKSPPLMQELCTVARIYGSAPLEQGTKFTKEKNCINLT